MGFRFRKSKKILPGVRVTVTKRGISTRIGGKHSGVSFSPTGKVLASTSIPGTGISYKTNIAGGKSKRKTTSNKNAENNIDWAEVASTAGEKTTGLLKRYVQSFKDKTSTKVITGVTAVALIGLGAAGGANQNEIENTDNGLSTIQTAITQTNDQNSNISNTSESGAEVSGVVDKSELEASIIEAWSYDGSLYTPESYQNMMSYVAADSYQAQIFNDPYATQDDINNAVAMLHGAIYSLEEVSYAQPASWEWTSEAPIVYYSTGDGAYAYHIDPNCRAIRNNPNVVSAPMDQLPFNIVQACGICSR